MCKSWFCVGMGWLPMSVAIMVAATFTISYCISVGLGHVPAEFPYISDTGTYIPESCIFGQLLNITAALAFATIYVRYKQVQEYNREASPAILRANKIALVIGGFACLGMSMVANFQETNELQVHVFAANLCFGPGVVYCYMQTWLSYKMAPFHATIFACRARILLCFFATLGFVFRRILFAHLFGAFMCFGCGVVYEFMHALIPCEMRFGYPPASTRRVRLLLAFIGLVALICSTSLCFGVGLLYGAIHAWMSARLYPCFGNSSTYRVRIAIVIVAIAAAVFASVFAALANTKWHGDDQTKWKPEDGGFTEHIFSTAFEWVLAISFLSYFFTFVREFQKITMETTLRMYTEELETDQPSRDLIGSSLSSKGF